MKPHRGTLILILGIVGIVICMPCGIAAWIMGKKDLQEMDAGLMDPAGRSMTNAGKICGMVAVILAAIVIVLQIVLVAAGAASR
jgi:hypothetical protein